MGLRSCLKAVTAALVLVACGGAAQAQITYDTQHRERAPYRLEAPTFWTP